MNRFAQSNLVHASVLACSCRPRSTQHQCTCLFMLSRSAQRFWENIAPNSTMTSPPVGTVSIASPHSRHSPPMAIFGARQDKKKVSSTMLNITTTTTTATTPATLLCYCCYHHYILQCATKLSYPVEAMESLAFYITEFHCA